MTSDRNQPSHVRVEATVQLGERRSLMVVTIEGRRLLLGLTPMQVSLVTELTQPSPDAAPPKDEDEPPHEEPGDDEDEGPDGDEAAKDDDEDEESDREGTPR